MAYHTTPVLSANLTQQIYGNIRDQILSLQLLPGEKLSEMRLASAYQCSRIPVREAVKALCMEGYLKSQPQVGSFVSYINCEKLEQIRYIRESLEIRVMQDGLAANAFAPIIGQLEENVDQMIHHYKKKEYNRVYELDDEFHSSFYKAARREFVRDFMGINDPDYTRARRIALMYDHQPELLIGQHQDILLAVKENNQPALFQAMHEHLINIHRVLPSCPEMVRNYFDPPMPPDAFS